MKLTLDLDARLLVQSDRNGTSTYPLFGREAFEILSHEWLRIGWSLKYYHSFTWLGYPILQIPEDIIRLQEAIYKVKPDVIIETGVFAGGSLAFTASLCEILGKGRVIGIDVKLRDEPKNLLLKSEIRHRVRVIEGDSTSALTLKTVMSLINPEDRVMVLLDSNHTAEHVAKELEMYSPLVTPGSCMLVADGVMKDLADVPGGDSSWVWDNPGAALREFLPRHPEFINKPNEPVTHYTKIKNHATYWPDGWLWRV